jgi:hypothetical protein
MINSNFISLQLRSGPDKQRENKDGLNAKKNTGNQQHDSGRRMSVIFGGRMEAAAAEEMADIHHRRRVGKIFHPADHHQESAFHEQDISKSDFFPQIQRPETKHIKEQNARRKYGSFKNQSGHCPDGLTYTEFFPQANDCLFTAQRACGKDKLLYHKSLCA